MERRRKPPKNKRKWRKRTEDKRTAEKVEGETQEGGEGDVVENPSMEAIHAVNKSWGSQEIPRPLETFCENIQRSRTLGRLWQKYAATHGILSIAETTTMSARDFQQKSVAIWGARGAGNWVPRGGWIDAWRASG